MCLAALPFVVWLTWRFARARNNRSAWRSVIDPQLHNVMLNVADDRGRTASAVMLALTLSLAVVALAGPTWQRIPQPVEQSSDALVIALDLSLSMYAADLEPSRLVRARLKLVDLLRERSEGYTALIAYAGDAHTVAPLTDDVRTVENLLGALTPEMMPVLGSRPAAALQLAIELFNNAGVASGRILFVTDGFDRLGDVTEHCSSHFPVSILGVGTADGAPIPLDFVGQRGRFLTDRAGRQIEARLDEDRLAATARQCHGSYHTISVTNDDLRAVLAPGSASDERDPVTAQFDLWVDLGQWLVIALLPFALLGFRRGAIVGLCIAIAPTADAGLWDDLWARPDQQAFTLLQNGEPERAVPLFEAPQWQGVARYRSGDFAGAQQRFQADASSDGHYNRGNALAMQGKLNEAIAAYEAALATAPDDEDVLFNKALVERMLAEKEQSDGNPNQDAPERGESEPQASQDNAGGSPDGDPGENNDAAPQDKGDGEDETEQDESKSSPQQQADAEQMEQPRDEQQEALEQWMRRVPDDPAGLLRRKFQYETNQRMRRGEYPDRDEERVW